VILMYVILQVASNGRDRPRYRILLWTGHRDKHDACKYTYINIYLLFVLILKL